MKLFRNAKGPFYLGFAAVQVFLFGLIFGSLLYGSFVFKISAARILSDSAVRSLKKDDFREAVYLLAAIQKNQFERITYHNKKGELVFSLPPALLLTPAEKCVSFYCYHPSIEMPLTFAPDRSLGVLHFTYNTRLIYLIAGITWITALALSVPLLSRMLRRRIELEQMSESYELSRQASHDLRSPLGAIQSAVRQLSTECGGVVDLIDKSAKRINAIANDLLRNTNASRVAGGGSSSDGSAESAINLVETLKDVYEERKLFAQRSGASFSFRAPEELSGLKIRICKSELERTLANLLNNAFEAIEKNGSVFLLLEKLNQYALISVGDNGIGIPENVVSKIGTKGFSYGKDGHEDSGFGLGVYYAKTMAEKAGGHLQVKSSIGKGTKITLALPIS